MKTKQGKKAAWAGIMALCVPLLGTPALAALPEVAIAHFAVTSTAASGRWDLGVVTDGRNVGDAGMPVLAVTPGGAGERIGLRAGDRLVAINGQALAGAQAPNSLLQAAMTEGNGEARLEVERDGETLVLSGRADDVLVANTAAVPAVEGCGYVSTEGRQPRVSRNIFPAGIGMINGKSTSLELPRHRVPAGLQVLVVNEMIDLHRLNSTQRHHIELMKRRAQSRAYKTLVVDVAPGTRYQVGAELLTDRLDADSIRDNAYWRPVVWEERQERCR